MTESTTSQETQKSEIGRYCEIVRFRSKEHAEALSRLQDLPGVMTSILRQELDSMVRTIWLLNVSDVHECQRLVLLTLNGQKWTTKTVKGKFRTVTDREMVELSDCLQGWTSSVYKFGCAFIHLSNFHSYYSMDPWQSLNEEEKRGILKHMRQYHGGPSSDEPSFQELSLYFPDVFKKIAGNLECYLEDLESKWREA